MPISVKQLLKALRSDIKAHNSSYKEQQRGMQELGITKLKEGRIDPIRMIRQNQIEFDDVPDLENLVAKRQFVVPTGLTSDLGATHLDVTFDPAVGYVVSPPRRGVQHGLMARPRSSGEPRPSCNPVRLPA